MKAYGTYFQNDPERPLKYGEVDLINPPRQRLRGEPLKEGIPVQPVMIGFCGTDYELMKMGRAGQLGAKFPAGTDRLVNGFKLLISVGLILITMLIYRIPPHPSMLWAFPMLLLLFLLSFGLSCCLLHFGVFFEDLANIVNVALRLLFYMSGIFYNPEKQLTGVVRYLMIRLNPTCYIITELRNTVLYAQTPLWHWFILWAVVGLVVSALGVNLIYRHERRYVNTV